MDEPLFNVDPPRSAGRLRRGLDIDTRRARKADVDLPGACVAGLRILADRIDQLERVLRAPNARPYDHRYLAELHREFRETYEQTFAALARTEDPLTHALAAFLSSDPIDGHPTSGDATELPAPQ